MPSFMPRFYEQKDYAEISRWWQAWGKRAPKEQVLSDTGLIVEGVAAGFLYFTNSSVALIEGFISNPKASKQERNHALNFITHELLSMARELGYHFIKCDTQNAHVKKRARLHGFKEAGCFSLFVKEI